MPLDKTSEIIAHFIGLFETSLEDAKLRESDQGFRYDPEQGSAYDGLHATTLLLRAPHVLDGYGPGLTPFTFPGLPTPELPPAAHYGSYAGQSANNASVDLDLRISIQIGGPALQGSAHFYFVPPPPSSISVVAHQSNYLTDNDLLLSNGATEFYALSGFDAQLALLVDIAGSLSPLSFGNPMMAAKGATDFMAEMTDSYTQLAQTAYEDASVAFLSGENAMGHSVNGVAVDSVPTLADLLPEHMKPATEETASAAVGALDVADGHDVIAGSTLSINETILSVQHVDAAVIAVMGDAISLSAIAQINVLYDHNQGPMTQDAGLNVHNIATRALSSTQDLTPSSQTPDALPMAWGVTRIEADVVCVNWVQQYNFLTDNDRAEITFSGEDSFLDFGDNTALNLVNLIEFAQGYDLIIIGGQYIDMTLISQTNVLLDDDFVTYEGDWPADISMDDNLLLNSAQIESLGTDSYDALPEAFANAGTMLAAGGTNISAELAQSDMFSGLQYLSVLYIEGDLINVASIEQTNILGDADQIRVELEALEEREDTPDGPLTITTGSNALVNLATVLEFGIDSTILVGGEVYDDLLLYQANLIDTDSDPTGVAHLPLATEAVAFLADDMTTDSMVVEAVIVAPTEAEAATADVMQTLLA